MRVWKGFTPHLSGFGLNTKTDDDNVMSEANNSDFGGTEKDLDGQMVTRKVQDGGRINFPDEYLEHSGVGSGDRVFIIVDGDGLRIVEADAGRLAITGIGEAMKMMFGDGGGE